MVSRLTQRVNDAATPELAPGEQIEATLGRAQSGGSRWFPVFIGGGLIGALLSARARKIYAVVVTNQRVLLMLGHVGALNLSYTLEGSCPRSAARLVEFKPGIVFAKLVLELPGAAGEGPRTLPLSVHMYQRKDARLVVAALTASPS